ncbi:hypothetical protein EDC30_104225 [Paucimonas lemoignei]|uniref:Uncharacterized protein n=1 Tax=Paucimonas lemoignei TaxID=29443 RepID=A0A4R3HW96_PAULE|nr:hypothetical protein [Paucimonas lemoignei]TCS37422.1 hypothetical protein EDC30_104225 [Paucimonas lemoignei]
MASWIIPALKAVLPHVGTIISAARPIFTKPKAEGGSVGLSVDAPVQQQIAELQAVAAQNDANIRELAEQLQRAVTALEDAALEAESRAKRMTRMCMTAMILSVIAIATSLILLINR